MPAAAQHPFHIMTKATGAICNIGCKYCFYLEKERLFPEKAARQRMSETTLEVYVKKYIESQPNDEVHFAWQGGEPTLRGLDFYQQAVAFQQKYANGKRIHNAFQTNGMLLDAAWCNFFAEHGFLIGLSIDGPAELHDRYRVTKSGGATHDKVVAAARLLQQHGCEFNTLTCVQRDNARHPLKVYRFLKSLGSQHMQFIPIVERQADQSARALELDHALPPRPGEDSDEDPRVTHWSVRPDDFGRFLIEIFERWVRKDVGTVYLQFVEDAFLRWMGVRQGGLCVFSETCGNAMAIEHNGDLFSCDHYVYPDYKLGNILTHDLPAMAQSAQQSKFGQDKHDTLTQYCRNCEVRFACNGDCPKHRFATTPDGEAGLSYLCPAYKALFNHIDPYMRVMVDLYRHQQPPARIMQLLEQGQFKPQRKQQDKRARGR